MRLLINSKLNSLPGRPPSLMSKDEIRLIMYADKHVHAYISEHRLGAQTNYPQLHLAIPPDLLELGDMINLQYRH